MRTRFSIYVLSGAFAAAAGLFQLARLATAHPDAGTGYDLESIAAVVIGGTDIFGGEGNIPGTVLGFLLIAVIKNGMTFFGVAPLLQTVVVGVLLIGAISLNNLVKFKRTQALVG